MTSERWRITEEILLAAWDAPPEAREALLTERCGRDSELLADVRSLMEAQQEADAWTAPPERISEEGPERRIGPYRLERLIGRGGMGAVYLAHRADEAFHQKVAIKVIGLPFELEPFRERFRRERQILAGLNHPNITHLIDGGVTADGELYLAMEYVEGLPLDEYCRGNNLTEPERLRLFRQVCGAVVYAHQNLIVHRDIKPSNILVSGEGVPKLLDFGTAKLLTEDAGLEDATHTGMGLVTAAYASPEQLRGEPASTLSDVYSLGVVLYELVSGERAFTASDTRRMEADRAPELPKPLRGDLDRIVRKALAPDPPQRYSTVEQLSEDVRRYLDGEPIIAHPPSLAYRSGKFVRRHTWGVILAAIFIIGLASAATFSMWQARAARRQADRAERINAFLNDMLGSPDPSWYNTLHNKGKNVTVMDVLDELRGRIGKELADQPQVEVELRQTVGRLYLTLGQHQQAREQLELALNRQIRATGRNDPEVGILYKNLAFVDFLARRNAEALRNATESLAILNHSGRKQDRQAIVEAYDVAALALYKSGHPLSEAEQPLREALTRSRQWFGDGGSTPALTGTLATFAVEQGKFEDAVRLSNECLALYRAKPGPMPVEAFTPLRNLAMVCLEGEDYACAVSRLREALNISGEDLGRDNLYNMNLRAHYALAIGLAGRAAEAEQELTEYIRKTPATGDSADLYLAMAEEFLGRVQVAAGELDAAGNNLRKALATYRQYRRSGDVRTAVTASRLGECLLAQNKRDEALPLLTESYSIILAAFGPSHIWSVQARDRLAKVAPSAKKM